RVSAQRALLPGLSRQPQADPGRADRGRGAGRTAGPRQGLAAAATGAAARGVCGAEYRGRGNCALGKKMEGPTMLRGIDVSAWQGTINWEQVQRDGFSFAMIKASEGLFSADPDF